MIKIPFRGVYAFLGAGSVLSGSMRLALSVTVILVELTGNIEFIRFNDDNTKTRRKFKYDPSSPENSKTNPLLMAGDIINVQRNLLGTSTTVIGSIARPLTSGFVLYSIISE